MDPRPEGEAHRSRPRAHDASPTPGTSRLPMMPGRKTNAHAGLAPPENTTAGTEPFAEGRWTSLPLASPTAETRGVGMTTIAARTRSGERIRGNIPLGVSESERFS
jgi:hypothetical protein